MPNPDTSHYLENARRWLSDWGSADGAVCAGIESVYRNVTSSHSSTSKPHSLTALIRRHVDGPFSNWLSSSGFLQTGFSRYLKSNQVTQVDDTLLSYSRAFISKNLELRSPATNDMYDEMEAEFLATIDYLRDFNRFCHTLGPAEKPVAVMYAIDKVSGEELAPYINRARRDRKASSRSSQEEFYPFYLHTAIYWSHDPNGCQKCIACDAPTEEEDLRNEFLKSTSLTDEIRSHLQDGGKFTAGSRQYSRSYCQIHSEVTNKSGNRRALRHRIGFASIIATMRRAEVSTTIDCNLIPIEFWRRFAALAMDSKKCRKHTHNIKTLTPVLHDKNHVISTPADREKAFLQVLQELRSIYVLLGLSLEKLAFGNWDEMPDLTYRVAKSPLRRND